MALRLQAGRNMGDSYMNILQRGKRMLARECVPQRIDKKNSHKREFGPEY
jgi:hypothetical protein